MKKIKMKKMKILPWDDAGTEADQLQKFQNDVRQQEARFAWLWLVSILNCASFCLLCLMMIVDMVWLLIKEVMYSRGPFLIGNDRYDKLCLK